MDVCNQTGFHEAWQNAVQRCGIYNPYTGHGAIKSLLPPLRPRRLGHLSCLNEGGDDSSGMKPSQQDAFSLAKFHSLGPQLLTYIRSNHAISMVSLWNREGQNVKELGNTLKSDS